MTDDLQTAREQIEQGEARQALWRLERARRAALSAGDVGRLREIVDLAAKAREQSGLLLAGRYGAVRLAAEQNLDYVERRAQAAAPQPSAERPAGEERLDTARHDLERGETKGALRALWTEKVNAAIRGDAMLAGVAVGAFGTLDEACAAMVATRSRFLPDPEARATYEVGYRRYLELFDDLRPAFAAFGPGEG